MSNLPKHGVSLVVENLQKSLLDLDKFNTGVEKSSQKMQKAAGKVSPFNKVLADLQKQVQTTGTNVLNSLPGGEVITGILSAIPGAALAAAAGVAALAAGFVALASRGTHLIGLGESFDRLTAGVGLSSQALLVDLRKAANGTISDMALIERANLALVGSTGEFGQAFGKALPKLLEAARASARATGQDIDFLYQSIVTGIKRGSPLILDNLGLVISVGDANEKYAESIGKTVAQLTEEEKKVALLNATLEAGQTLIDSVGNAQETNADKIARANATITNTLDSLSIALQPAFGKFLDIGQGIIGNFQKVSEALAPILGGIVSGLANGLSHLFNIYQSIIQPILDAVLSFAPYISIALQAVVQIFDQVGQVIQNIVGGIVRFLQDVAKNFFGLDLTNLGPNLFNGAAAAFGSFANGIIKVANTLIFPAIINIAKFIADLLIGFSPPKKGPLSVIDKGGENLMLAWLDGIAGVSLDPVEQVAAEVSQALGNIGKANLTQVEARLAELDTALLPFQNRLDIVKSRFEAIAAPAEEALSAIDRQIAAAEAALASGDQAAAERIRLLDAQREAIQANLDAQQSVVDKSQVQLALAQAQQAQERALLNIRKSQLQVTDKVASAVDKATKPAKEEKEKAGAAAEPELANAGGSGGFVTPETSVLDLFGGQGAVDAAKQGLIDAFSGEIDPSALFDFQANQGLLQDQLTRIGSVDLGAKLQDKFKGLSDLFDPNVEGSPANVVGKFFSPDPGTPGSLASFVDGIGPTLDSLKSDVESSVSDFFDSVFNPNREGSPASIVQTLFADASTPNSIASFFSNLGPNIEAAAPAIKEQLNAAFGDMFDPEVEGSPANLIVNAVKTLTGDQETADSVASFFKDLPTNVSDAASGLFDQLQLNVFDPVKNFLIGTGEGTLSGILDGAVQFFIDLPGRIGTALVGIGATIYSSLVLPVISGINSLIELAEGGVKTFINNVADFVTGIADALGGVIDTSFIRNVGSDLKSKAGSLTFGRISTELPAALQQVPAAATGGLFTKGLIKVGEQGPEYIGAASRIGILPAQITQALNGLGSIMAAPAPMMVPAGGDTYNNTSNNSSSTFNFNGVGSDYEARRRYNRMRAGMR